MGWVFAAVAVVVAAVEVVGDWSVAWSGSTATPKTRNEATTETMVGKLVLVVIWWWWFSLGFLITAVKSNGIGADGTLHCTLITWLIQSTRPAWKLHSMS